MKFDDGGLNACVMRMLFVEVWETDELRQDVEDKGPVFVVVGVGKFEVVKSGIRQNVFGTVDSVVDFDGGDEVVVYFVRAWIVACA